MAPATRRRAHHVPHAAGPPAFRGPRLRTRVLSAVLVSVLALGLAACGSPGETEPDGAGAGGVGAGAGTSATPASGSPSDEPDFVAADPADAGAAAGSEGAELLTGTVGTVGGGTVDLATLVGTPTALWFWAPWCPICRARTGGIIDVQAEFADTVNVVGVAGLSADLDDMRAFVDDTGIGTFAQVADTTGEVYSRMGVEAQDSWILVDAAGNVTRVFGQGADDLREHFEKLTS